MKKVTEEMKDDIYCFSCPGFSSVMMHKHKAMQKFKFTNQGTDAEKEEETVVIAKAEKLS